jgi:hypothetical protein
MSTLAVVVTAIEKRRLAPFPAVMDSIIEQHPDEVVVVADFPWQGRGGWTHIHVPSITRTTIDGLIKRDAGWVATRSESVLFLCDDHRLAPDFVSTFRKRYNHQPWSILAPSRYTVRDKVKIPLNVGEAEGYVGGHGVVVRRNAGRLLPWTASPHHPSWDLLWTHQMVRLGCPILYAGDDLAIEDIEPGASPWL